MRSEVKYYSYSEYYKIKIVKELEELGLKQSEVCRKYGIPDSTLRGWLKKYSKDYSSGILRARSYGGHVMMKDEKDDKIEDLESDLSDALAKVAVYEEMLKLAKEEYKVDLKKNYCKKALKNLEQEEEA